ncbi:MAG TPA: biosynthetic peptidoglycan transglycosylase, partial [Dehalococcoidia bacterium]|nr:biosynthetic peptidoglycan transglycosylase [Dehalococcoidia bacterium]
MARNGHGYDAWRMRARRTLRRRNARGKRGTPRWMLAAVGLAGVGAFLFIAAAIAGIFVYESYAADLVPPDQLAINEASQGAKILDRNGNLLYEYVDDRAGLRRPIALQDVSEAFLAATIATEDDSFFTNPGVNWKGLARAAWENSPFSGADIFGGSGGSSITQQLVKNVYIPQEERQKRTIDRKLRETVYALEL